MNMLFHGGSWGVGVLSAFIYLGHVSPWWLLAATLLLIEMPWATIHLWPRPS